MNLYICVMFAIDGTGKYLALFTFFNQLRFLKIGLKFWGTMFLFQVLQGLGMHTYFTCNYFIQYYIVNIFHSVLQLNFESLKVTILNGYITVHRAHAPL